MTENNFLTKTLTKTALTRRSFLKWSAALGGTTALAGGLNYGLKAAEEAAVSEGEWIVAACWHNCGGRCPNYALVKDGIVIRQKTDDSHTDTPDFPQQRGCARGRVQRHQCFGADRIKYPMKRKNWEPGGGWHFCDLVMILVYGQVLEAVLIHTDRSDDELTLVAYLRRAFSISDADHRSITRSLDRQLEQTIHRNVLQDFRMRLDDTMDRIGGIFDRLGFQI